LKLAPSCDRNMNMSAAEPGIYTSSKRVNSHIYIHNATGTYVTTTSFFLFFCLFYLSLTNVGMKMHTN
jgi:hypothetical protein